ncbi:PAS domain S-box protein, partial [Nostoc sp. UIC 10890]
TAKADIYTAEISPCHVEFLESLQVRANLVVPILLGDELWGLLAAHHCAAPREWQSREIDLLRQLGEQVSIAIQQAALFEQVQTELRERKEAEIALRESQIQLQRQLAEIETIYQSAPIGLSLLDTNLRFIRINQRLAEMNGFSVQAHIGCTVRELLPDLADAAEQLLCSILETGEPVLNVEITGETPAQPGVQRTWLESFLPLKDGDCIIGISTVCEEITERKQAQIALQQLNAKLEQQVVQRTAQLRSANDRLLETVRQQQQTQIILLEQAQLLDLAHDTIITRDLNGAIGFWNDGAEYMYGWTKAEAWGQISHILLKTQFPQSLSEIETELFEKGYWEGELIHFTWDDRPVNVASRWVLQKDNAGQPIKILEINNDITERKLAEASLQQYVHEVEDLYNNAPCGYHSLDGEGNFIRINDTEINWLGYTRDEIFHKKFSDIATSVSKQVFQENFPRFKQQGWLNNLEFEIVSKDGTTRWISLNATAIKDKAGNFVMSRSTLFDISERKRMEEALLESEQRYRSVITVMAEGIVLQQSDGRITACNDSAERILGLTADEMMGQTSIDPRWQAIHEDGTSFPGSTHPAIVTLRTGKPQFNVIMGVYKPDGSLSWISINSLPLFESDESKPYAVVASFTDITVRKQAQIALQQQTERERMVYAIAQHIRESLDLDEILNTTVAEVRQFLQTDRVMIYRFNPDWSGTVVMESVAFGWKPILNMEITDTYFVETQGRQSYQQGLISVTPDIYTAGLTACHLELLEQLQVRAKLVVRILQGDRLWGLLIAHHCCTPRQWQPWESELL